MNWRDCEHEWMKKGDVGSEFLGVGNSSYQWQCSKCKIYSYVGKLYDELPDSKKISISLWSYYHTTKQ